jgi:hypothetical protein
MHGNVWECVVRGNGIMNAWECMWECMWGAQECVDVCAWKVEMRGDSCALQLSAPVACGLRHHAPQGTRCKV